MASQNSKKKNTKKTNNKANTNNKKVVANKKEEKVVKEAKKVETKKEVKKDVKDIQVPKFEKKEEKKEKVVKEKKCFSLTSKQKDLVLVILVVVLLVVACIVTSNKEQKLDIELPVALTGEAGFNEITYSEYLEKIDSEEPFLVVIVKDGCGYCEMYEPILEEVAGEYKLPINYINLTHLTEEEYNALSTTNSYLKKNQWGTPTTLFMLGDSVIDSIGGYVEKADFVSFVEENFVVEQDAE